MSSLEFAPIEPLPADPQAAAGNLPPTPEEQRKELEAAMSSAVTDLFLQNAGHVKYEPDGRQVLKLYLPTTDEGRRAPILRVSQRVFEDGSRASFMSYLGSGWHNHFRLSESKGGRSPRFEACGRDPVSGLLTVIDTPDPTPENPHPADPQADELIIPWATYWLGNLAEATPKKPRGRFGRLGKSALSAISGRPAS